MKHKIDLDPEFELPRDEAFHKDLLQWLTIIIGFAMLLAYGAVVFVLVFASWLRDNGVF